MNEQPTQVAPTLKDRLIALANDWRRRRRDYIGPSTLQCADELEATLADRQPDDAPDKAQAFALKLWARLNERRCHLIERDHAGVASDAERIELAQLQILADESIHTFAPLPIAELEAYMKSKGIDVSNELSARDCPTCDDDAEDCIFNPPAPDELAHELPYVSGMVDRIRELEARLKTAESDAASIYLQGALAEGHVLDECPTFYDWCNCTVEALAGFIKRVDELEARLTAIDAALDDADAPEATEAHALDDDPIIERIKLWRHVDNEMTAQLADYPFLKQELERLHASIGPQTCDIHAAFSAGCLNCRLAQREAQLAEANAQRNTVFENMKTQSELVARLRAALEAYPEWTDDLDSDGCPDGWVTCVACGGGGRVNRSGAYSKANPPTHKPNCARQAALNPRGEGEE